MDAERWARMQALFHEVADLPSAERRAFLESTCGHDPSLLDGVWKMLEADAGPSVLDRDIAELAETVIGLPTDTPVPGGTFGPYRLSRLLGEGGMGVVYLARREDLGSVAAIKILRDAWLSPARRERFAAEQRTLARLDHPSIARLFDADTLADGTPWFVMEFVDGVPITEYCRSTSSSITARLRLFRTVCEAVQHAHAHLVVHRDLKPSNILVTADSRVKLLDFGISKQLETLEGPADQTRTVLMMTPAYAAPEQLLGEPVGIRTDVYALGVLLYELLTGRVPFDVSSLTPAEAREIVIETEPATPGLGADLDVLCLTAMHKDASRRYASVEALARDVDHFLNNEPLDARPDSFAYRAGKFVRRRWQPLVALAAMLVVVAGLASFYAIRLSAARSAALDEAARTQRIQRFTLNLLEGGDEASGPAESLRVITLVDRGVQQARGLDAEPLIQSELYSTLGGIYQKLGKLDEADRLLQTALQQRQNLLGGEHPDVADSLVALGQLRDSQASFDEAERLIRDGLEKGRRRLGAAHPSVARATTALGQVLENRGSYADAATVLEQAVGLLSQPGQNEADLATAMAELANTRFYLGQYDESESLNQRVLLIERRLYGDHHPQVADTLVNLGAIQFERGRYAEAERFQRDALGIMRTWHGASHPRTASALTMVARAIIQQGERLDEAAAILRESLAIQERVHGAVHPRVASALNELGIVALRQRQMDEAERLFQRMVSIYRQVYSDKHYYIGVGLSNLGGVQSERGEHGRAEALFRDALRQYGETLDPAHQLVGIARVRLGRSILAQRRYQEAEVESLAGYAILMKQTNPPSRWVNYAREDLAAAYAALNQPENAASFRALIGK